MNVDVDEGGGDSAMGKTRDFFCSDDNGVDLSGRLLVWRDNVDDGGGGDSTVDGYVC